MGESVIALSPMADIYEHFSCYTRLPVRLRDVRDQILQTGHVHQIIRFPVEIDELVLHGALRVFKVKPPYADEERVIAHIAYGKGLPEPERRLVCCKEMLHLANGHKFTANTAATVTSLIEQIVLPRISQLPAVRDDQMGMLRALVVLLPRDAIEELKAKQISPEDAAKLARIPEEYAQLAMSDYWSEVVKDI